MYLKLVAVIFIAVTLGNAEARNYPVPFPYWIGGLDELKMLLVEKTLLVEKNRRIFIDSSQEIELGRGVKIFGFFQSDGSGIETINAYIYACEVGECKLFVFLRTWASKVTLELIKETKEMVLKSHDGTIIFRMPFPFISAK